MTGHETTQQRARRHKRDPYAKGAQLAPAVKVEPVLCARVGCSDPRLIHRDNKRCLRVGCGCTEYLEAL